MNYQKAKQYLEVTDYTDVELENMDIIKKQYRRLALKYHPDKNPTSEAKIRFLEITESYEFFCDLYFSSEPTNIKNNFTVSYSELLKDFLNSIFCEGNIYGNIYVTQILQQVIEKMTKLCEDKSIEILKRLNKQMLTKLYEIMFNNKDILLVNDTFLEKIYGILDEKTKNDLCVILNPSLEDLFDHNLYKLHHKNQIFIIPLWHHELVYDVSGTDLYVKCFPMLPDNITIDSDNNIIVEITVDIETVFNDGGINVELVDQWFRIPAKDIRLLRDQTVVIKGVGIPVIQTDNIYDINRKSNIIVDIFLTNL
jgi:hypothetical protein